MTSFVPGVRIPDRTTMRSERPNDLDGRIDRLRLEADTILTRYSELERALETARNASGDHWERGRIDLTLQTPDEEPIDLSVDLDTDPGRAAAWRYDRANELDAERKRRAAIDDRLDPLPPDPVAYLLCYHLDTVGGNYPKSMAGYVSADRGRVVELCDRMRSAGLFERVEPGTVKQRRVKAKRSDEVRQHHTYYRLSRAGDHLLRFLSEREGRVNALRHLPAGAPIARSLVEDGPLSARSILTNIESTIETAADDVGSIGDGDATFEWVRHHCEALRRLGVARGTDEYRASATAEELLDMLEE